MEQERDFQILFKQNYRALCLYATRYLKDVNEAEDLVQEVFIKFWHTIQRTPAAGCRSYLYRMVKNALIDRSRRKKIETVELDPRHYQIEEFFQPDSDDSAGIDNMLAVIASLPERSRIIFMEVCANGKKYQEVADQLNISLNTVKTQLSRGLKVVRSALNAQDFSLFLWLFSIFP